MTEREKILAMREGYAEALLEHRGNAFGPVGSRRAAAQRFPLPVERVRVVEDKHGYGWMVEHGQLWCRLHDGDWWNYFGNNEGTFAAIRDVILNPTELVDDDGGEQ